jgi:predicted Fe-S protein YdhL (DUF1289 family)
VGKEIENPCISVCKFSGELCVGCGRNKDEIRQWKRMKKSERKAALKMAEQRLKSLKKAGKK